MNPYNSSIRTLKIGIAARGSLIARGLEGLDMLSVLSVGHVDTLFLRSVAT